MDRHWNTTITRSKVLWSVKSHYSIATTWWISPSRKRRSDPLQWHHRRVQEEEVRRCFAVVTWRLDIKFGKTRRAEEKVQILCEFKLFQSIPVPSSNSRTFRRKCYWSCIARQYTDTDRIYQVPLPRREREWIEFYYKKWINSRRYKPEKEEDKQSSSQQWTRWRTFIEWWELHAIWRNQGSRRTRILGNAFKILYFGATWSPLTRKACNFTKHGHIQSFSTTHYLQLALRKRYVWKLRMSSTRRFA